MTLRSTPPPKPRKGRVDETRPKFKTTTIKTETSDGAARQTRGGP
jgi:hypothetical protein